MNLLVIVVLGIILEIAVWIGVAQFISGWYVFFWFIVAFFIGINLIRSNTSFMMPQKLHNQHAQEENSTNIEDLGKKMTMACAGILLAIPGLVSDLFALLIMIPGVQNAAKKIMLQAMQKRQQAMMEQMMNGMGGNTQGQNPFEEMMRQMYQQQNGRDSTIIDGEAREITPETKRIDLKDVK